LTLEYGFLVFLSTAGIAVTNSRFMKKNDSYDSFIKHREAAKDLTIYFRYIIGVFAVSILYIFRHSLPFPYPHFLIVCSLFTAGTALLHVISIHKKFAGFIYECLPFFDTAFAPLILYCSGGFLSPFIITHLITAVAVSIVYPEKKVTQGIVYLMLITSYTGVALLQKFGVLAVHVEYARMMITNDVFFIFVVVGITWVILLCYIILNSVSIQINKIFQTLKGTYDSVVRNISEYMGKDQFKMVVTGLAETLKMRGIFIGMFKSDTENNIIIPVTVWDRWFMETTSEIMIEKTIFQKVVQQKECFYKNRVLEFLPDDQFLKSLDAEGFYGITLNSINGEPLGVICAIDDKAIVDEYTVKSTLKIFAWHAAAQIERLKAGEKYEEVQKQLAHTYKLEAMTQIAGHIAHDFNNMLQGIIGSTQVLQAKLDKESPLANYPEKVLSISRRAAAVANQFLAFARKGEYVKKIELDFNRLVIEIAGMLDVIIDKIITIKTDIQPGMKPMLYGDPSVLENMLVNLAVNARDAMPGGGTLSIKTELVCVDRQFIEDNGLTQNQKQGDYVLMSISDTGTGMDEETKAQIFKPFFTTKPAGKGTGLGLAAVRNCVDNHSGFICVDSEPGKGSTFRIYLPLLERKEPVGSDKQKEISSNSGE